MVSQNSDQSEPPPGIERDSWHFGRDEDRASIAVTGCKNSKKDRVRSVLADPVALASETIFTVSEVEALLNLYKKLSCSITNDGLIQKEELLLALFNNYKKKNLFADRVCSFTNFRTPGGRKNGYT
uniref:Calcineurin B-like protein n=1 Tax=Nicotiana tabacum TaxID=4097 RepID=A0A1S4DEC0_TOBAC|nr:PREDICTED: calcineurin B-like protein 7 [Nicotiana tabacum]